MLHLLRMQPTRMHVIRNSMRQQRWKACFTSCDLRCLLCQVVAIGVKSSSWPEGLQLNVSAVLTDSRLHMLIMSHADVNISPACLAAGIISTGATHSKWYKMAHPNQRDEMLERALVPRQCLGSGTLRASGKAKQSYKSTDRCCSWVQPLQQLTQDGAKSLTWTASPSWLHGKLPAFLTLFSQGQSQAQVWVVLEEVGRVHAVLHLAQPLQICLPPHSRCQLGSYSHTCSHGVTIRRCRCKLSSPVGHEHLPLPVCAGTLDACMPFMPACSLQAEHACLCHHASMLTKSEAERLVHADGCIPPPKEA